MEFPAEVGTGGISVEIKYKEARNKGSFKQTNKTNTS